MGIDARFERLERSHLRLKRAVFLVFATAGAVLLMGQGRVAPDKEDELRVRRLVVEDSKGVEAIVVEAVEVDDGPRTAVLRVCDAHGDTRWCVTTRGQHAELRLTEATGQRRLVMSQQDGGEVSLSMGDRFGNGRLGLGADVGAGFYLCDRQGRRRVKLEVWKDGSYSLLDGDGVPVWQQPPDVRSPMEVARDALAGVALVQCKTYYDGACLWRVVHREFPKNLEEMAGPLRAGEEDDFLELVDDPWGNAYILVVEGRKIRVLSCGPDGQRGTKDDIVFPPSEAR